MQRIPLIDVGSAATDVRQNFEQFPIRLNIFRMMAHAVTSFRLLIRLDSSIISAQQREPEQREYAILLAAQAFGFYQMLERLTECLRHALNYLRRDKRVPCGAPVACHNGRPS